MSFVYNYTVTQKEINHKYAKKQGIAKDFLLSIHGSEDEAYSEKYWYFFKR